ncbi:hemolysin III family channel protein [Purpureocillium lavendulum]|uniref:Hemolysin III family channel protein n=1 Tax=Purpureocillium lavendulum TaxID=1247861 RepID=A0AB34G545_9HYPO|nr:hemolysin III family channel protein [Purpureocillium lavendulum]
MDSRARSAEAQDYAASLEFTLKELQRKVKEHETELDKLRSKQQHDAAPLSLSPQAQAAVLKSALEDVTNAEPFLPFPGSVLPALVALRKTHRTIVESKAYLAAQGSETERLRRQLEADRAGLKDQQLLTDALEARIQSLRREAESEAALRPQDGAKKRIAELEARKRGYDAGTKKLMKSLLGFIDNRLAGMLAAEELGGPVVGDLMDVESADLAAGFNAAGKLKRVKEGTDVNQDKRQRRIDDIWGTGAGADDEGGGGGVAEGDDEVAAAGREMRSLTEELLNALGDAKGDNSASYVQLGRESAAARFLVRSRVAQFHPKDATRVRLVDFGRELED